MQLVSDEKKIHRNTINARKKRLLLRRLLGMKCAECGSKRYYKLEFDLIIPCGNENHHSKMCWLSRMNFYLKQHYEHKNVQLLCGGVGGCHGRKTGRENAVRHTKELEPF